MDGATTAKGYILSKIAEQDLKGRFRILFFFSLGIFPQEESAKAGC